jgi:hypothetical protein
LYNYYLSQKTVSGVKRRIYLILLRGQRNFQPIRALCAHTSTEYGGGQMFKPIVRITAAALAAGAIAFAITVAPAAHDRAENRHAAEQAPLPPYPKADRLRVPVRGSACSLRGWPDFEPKCQFDVRETAGDARTVRVIALR